MEIEVGEYIRTNNGIIRKVNKLFLNIVIADKPYIGFYKEEVIEGIAIGRNEIVKHSPNIIDLIEVGDYVNGNIVYEVLDDEIELLAGKIRKKRLHFISGHLIDEENIKSIVTKEMYKSVEYEVE